MRVYRIATLLCLILVSTAGLPALANSSLAVQASRDRTGLTVGNQSPLNQIDWSPPANLSRSGAASQPRMVVASNGNIQAFWMDKFDGLTTAVYNGSVWSLPIKAPIEALTPNPNAEEPVEPPTLFVDAQDRIHAFWHSSPDRVTGQKALVENQMLLGTTTWSLPVRIAESALVYDLSELATNEIYIAYIRDYRSDLSEPGIFVRETFGGATWQSAIPVHNSIYYRNLIAPPAFIKTASSGNLVSVVWTEPRLGMVYYSDSYDQGTSWTQPRLIEFAGMIPSNPILLPLPEGGLLRIWQDNSQTNCTLYQQRLDLKGTGAPPPAAETPAAVPVGNTPVPPAELNAREWSQPVRIFNSLQSCPGESSYVLDGSDLYWYWGGGTPSINLTMWNSSSSQWYEPHAISLNFEDFETSRFVQLDELALIINGGKIMIAGTDITGGEVWAASGDRSALEFVSSPASPWLQPVLVSQTDQLVREPTVAIDSQGWGHLIWSQELNNSGSSLFYSRYEEQQTLQPVEIFKGGNGTISRQPSLIADSRGTLHLSWVGGANGLLSYSKALVDKAASTSGWVPPKNLDAHIAVSRPQIIQAASGRLYIIYTIPVNENRGVFLVFSDDFGENWSRPVVVFDAVSAGWEGVDRPAIAVTPNGGVHVAFSRLVGIGASPSEGIYYTKTQLGSGSDNFDSVTWSEPFPISPIGYEWPRLIFVSGQLHILFSNNNSLGHRWLLENEQQTDGAGWGDNSRVPGWQDLSFSGEPPFSVTADALNIYLVSKSTPGSALYYSVWSIDSRDTSNGRWSQQEVVDPGGQWINSDSMVAASTVPSGGKLLVAWLATDITTQPSNLPTVFPGLLFSIRNLDAVQPPAAPIIEPGVDSTNQATQIPLPTATSTPFILSDSGRDESQPPISPQALGGGLAAVIVVIIFVGIMMRGRSHSP